MDVNVFNGLDKYVVANLYCLLVAATFWCSHTSGWNVAFNYSRLGRNVGPNHAVGDIENDAVVTHVCVGQSGQRWMVGGRWSRWRWWWWSVIMVDHNSHKSGQVHQDWPVRQLQRCKPSFASLYQRVAHVFRWMEIVARIDRGHTWETANTGEALRHVRPVYRESGLLSNWTLKRISSFTILSILVWVAVFAVILCDIAVQISRISK